MVSISPSSYLIFCLVVIAWCALHSAMISVTVTQLLQKHAGVHYRFYRLFFNMVALLTLIPVIIYQQALRTEPFFNWDGYLRVIQIILIIIGVILFLLGGKKYDARRFIGITQLGETKTRQSMSATGDLDTTGIHGLIRHPWYTALLLILWARPLDISTLILNAVFTAYLIIGSWLEERKLVIEFGDAYRQYQKNVSMLLPLKWLRSRMHQH